MLCWISSMNSVKSLFQLPWTNRVKFCLRCTSGPSSWNRTYCILQRALKISQATFYVFHKCNCTVCSCCGILPRCSPLFVLLILPVLQTEIIPLLITDYIIKSQLLSRGARMSGSNISSLVSRKKKKKNLKRVPILFSSKISFNAVIHQNKTNFQYMFSDIIFMTTTGYRVIYPRTWNNTTLLNIKIEEESFQACIQWLYSSKKDNNVISSKLNWLWKIISQWFLLQFLTKWFHIDTWF